MRSKYILIFFVLIIISMVNIGCIGKVYHSGNGLSELNLTVKPDKEIVCRNQSIQIYFNLTNQEKNVKAYDFNLVALLSKSLALPSQTIRISNEKGKMANEDNEGKLSIYSNFNNHNEGRGDSAEISPDGIMKIHLTSLNKSEKISVKYITNVENKMSQEPQKICSIEGFHWDYIKNNKNKLIKSFKIINNKPVINEFNINVEPEYNITCSNGPNETLFRHSNINLTSKCYDSDNDKISIEYFYKKIGSNSPPDGIESWSEISDLGTYQFQIKASDLYDSNFTNNSKFFNVVDLIEYQRSPASYILLVQALFVAILILIYIHLISKKPSLLENKQIFIKYVVIPILITTHLLIYYYYFCSNNYYRSLVWIESSMMIVSYLLFTMYTLCDGNRCQLLGHWDFCKTIIGMFISVLLFHYFLPSILSQKILYTVLLAIFLNFLRLILVNRHKIKDTISISTKKSNSTISMIGMIIGHVAVISVIIYIVMPIPTFRPKLDILDLIIIEIMGIAWLIFTIELGLYPDRLAEFIKSDISIKEILKSALK
jgi:hypothetical protein